MYPLSYLVDILHEEFIQGCAATPTDWLRPIASESNSVVLPAMPARILETDGTIAVYTNIIPFQTRKYSGVSATGRRFICSITLRRSA